MEWVVLGIQVTMAGLFGLIAWRFYDRERAEVAVARLRARQGAFAGSIAGVIMGIVLITEGDAVRLVGELGFSNGMFLSFILTGYVVTVLGLASFNLVLAMDLPAEP